MGASAAILAALSASPAAAQTWTGATSNDWTVGSNWSGGTAPAGGTVLINTVSSPVLGLNGAATGTTGTFTIGSPGASTLTIENGSALTSTGTINIGTQPTGTATVTVTGAGSQWIANGTLFVASAGTGILNIENGATVIAATSVRLGGAPGHGPAFLNISDGTLETARLTLAAGTQANFDNAVLRANAANAAWITNLGTLNIEAGGLTIDSNGFAIGTAAGLQGAGGLTKIGAGVLTLSGDSTYAGETLIDAGTLALTGTGSISNSSRVVANSTFDISGLTGAGTDIQSLAGSGAVNLGAKTLTLTNDNDLFSGVISGTGGLILSGSTETLSGANTYTGGTTLTASTLRAGAAGAFSAGSAFVTDAGTTLDLNGFNQTVASLSNAGTVHMGATPGTVLTVNGNYVGNGGTLLINTVLAGDTSATDELVVNGSTSGSTSVKVTNVGGLGAQTVNGIRIIDVAGASNGTFSLQGNYVFQGQQAVIAGAYAYTLQKDAVGAPADGDWYLRSSLISPPASDPAPASPIYQPGVALYENYAQVLLGLNGLPTLQQRVGDRYTDGTGATTPSGNATQTPIWVRVEGQHGDIAPQATAASTYSFDQFKVQAGIDGPVLENSTGKLIFGFTAQFGTVDANVSSFYGNGRIQANGYGISPTLTWYANDGFYVDAQAQATKYVSDLNSTIVGGIVNNNDGFGYAFSVESGKRIGLGNGWSIIPQAQLIYSSVDFTGFADRFGAQVGLDNANSLLGRAGLQLNYQRTWRDAEGQLTSSDIYGIANLHYEFLDGTDVNVSGTNFVDSLDRLWGSVGGGGSYSWHGGKYSLYGEVSYNTSLSNIGKSDSYQGVGGFRVVW
ncbi:MAG: autotransporter outer membrane beta-barrel domain-containing protein [Pseudomonadota bacterium]